jgi:diguanylate cyclase (GGDEF)-like protein
MKRGAALSVVTWLIITAASLFWNTKQSKQQFNDLALHSARSFFQQIVITREWSASHGGVFVPVTEDTQPNPYLDDPQRDIKISDDLQLTKLNPSYITRQIAEIAATRKGIQFHITSLEPVRPQNKATAWETEALHSFEKGIIEKGQFFYNEKNISFAYMAPLIAEKPCLKCHPKNREGDIRGGISVTLPISPRHNPSPLFVGHFLLSLAGIIGILFFWTILTRAYDRIHRQAVVDSLTGVANRRSFSTKILEEFNRSRRQKQPISILMCDIDNFKEFNDNYGHTAGDKCLTLVAQTIEKSKRRPSDFLARYGGEEFIMILPETNFSGALKVANRVIEDIKLLEITHKTSTPHKILTLSIGAATTFAERMGSHEELVRQADTALYLAKKKGKNRVEAFREAQ